MTYLRPFESPSSVINVRPSFIIILISFVFVMARVFGETNFANSTARGTEALIRLPDWILADFREKTC